MTKSEDNSTGEIEGEATDKYPIFIASSNLEDDPPSPTISPQLLQQLQQYPEKISVSVLNDTLKQDGSEQKSVVFVGESSRYIPVKHLRTRPAQADYRSESWDRDSRRYRNNFTRVQRKLIS